MQAVILAGGQGMRMRSVVADRPPCMLLVAGRPLLEHLIRRLVDQGVRDIVLATGYRSMPIRAHFGDGHLFGCEIRYSQESAHLGTAGALRLAEPLLAERFLLLHGNALVDLDVEAFAARHAQTHGDALLGVGRPEVGQAPDVRLDAEGRVLAMGAREDGCNAAWNGVALLEHRVVRLVPLGVSDLEQSVFVALARRHAVHGMQLPGARHSVATPEAYARTLAAHAPSVAPPSNSAHQQTAG